MAEDNGQKEESHSQNQPLPTTQQTTQESNPQSTNQSSTPPFIKELRDTMNALPERIAMAVTASFPQQSASAPETPESPKSSEKNSHSASDSGAPRGDRTKQPTPPGKQSFTEWWIGVPAGTLKDSDG